MNPTADPKDPGQYSLSTYEKPRDVKRFACVNCDIREPIPIAIGKTRGRFIVKMLRDEISIRQLLLDYTSAQVSIHYADGLYKKTAGGTDWNPDSTYLPKKDSFMYAEDGEFDDEIKYFTEIDDGNMDAEYTLQVYTEEVELYNIDETIYDMETDTIPSQINEIIASYVLPVFNINKMLDNEKK